MEEKRSTAGQGIGIAGLILGICAVPLAIIPCTFPLALLFAAAGIILSAVGMAQASRANGPKGLPVSGLVVSVIGMMIALMWGLFIASSIHDDGKAIKQEILDQISKKVEENIDDTFDDIDKEFEEIGDDMEEVLEDLELEDTWEDIDWGGEITDEELERALKAYEDLIENYTGLVEEAREGVISAGAELAKVSAKAVVLAAKLTSIAPRLTEEQLEKFEELHKKYLEAFKKAEESAEEE
jgi:hypothetical protein